MVRLAEFLKDGEHYLNGNSQLDGSLRMRMVAPTELVLERRQDGAFIPLTLNVGAGGLAPHSANIGVASATGVTVTEALGRLHTTVFTLQDVEIPMVDAGAAGSHGTVKLYDFPPGLLYVMGVTADTFLIKGAGGIAGSAAMVGALGSGPVQTDNATLFGAEADVLPSQDVSLSGIIGTLRATTTAQEAGAVHDGTETARALHLNLAVPDADSTADDIIVAIGTATVTWANLGDVEA